MYQFYFTNATEEFKSKAQKKYGLKVFTSFFECVKAAKATKYEDADGPKESDCWVKSLFARDGRKTIKLGEVTLCNQSEAEAAEECALIATMALALDKNEAIEVLKFLSFDRNVWRGTYSQVQRDFDLNEWQSKYHKFYKAVLITVQNSVH